MKPIGGSKRLMSTDDPFNKFAPLHLIKANAPNFNCFVGCSADQVLLSPLVQSDQSGLAFVSSRCNPR